MELGPPPGYVGLPRRAAPSRARWITHRLNVNVCVKVGRACIFDCGRPLRHELAAFWASSVGTVRSPMGDRRVRTSLVGCAADFGVYADWVPRNSSWCVCECVCGAPGARVATASSVVLMVARTEVPRRRSLTAVSSARAGNRGTGGPTEKRHATSLATIVGKHRSFCNRPRWAVRRRSRPGLRSAGALANCPHWPVSRGSREAPGNARGDATWTWSWIRSA
jgi:hypothetical protein